MKKIFKATILKIILLPFYFLGWFLLKSQADMRFRRLLGVLFNAMRFCAHDNYVKAVKSKYNIHQSVYWGEDTLIYGDGKIFIDEKTYIGKNSFVLSNTPDTTIKIGKYCAISHGVHIRTEINKKKKHFKEDLDSPPLGADIEIGDYVWIGAHCFVGGGISIGSNSIIGSNSVVTCDVPPNTVFAGVPAKFVKNKSDYKNS